MEAFDRQVRIRGTTDACSHPHEKTEAITSQGGDIIGMRCRLCGVIFGKARCAGCDKDRWCTVVSRDGAERYCSEDCRKKTIAGRAAGTNFRAGRTEKKGAPRR